MSNGGNSEANLANEMRVFDTFSPALRRYFNGAYDKLGVRNVLYYRSKGYSDKELLPMLQEAVDQHHASDVARVYGRDHPFFDTKAVDIHKTAV